MSLFASSCRDECGIFSRLAGRTGKIFLKMVPAPLLPAILIPFLLLGMQPAPAIAESAVTCHCFQNRSYTPSDRFAADDYILATAFNNLLARVFAVPHREVVLLKMKEGVDEDELLIAMYLSSKTGMGLRTILAQRRAARTWPEILASPTQGKGARQDEVVSRLRAGAKTAEAAALVADAIIGEFYRASPEAVQKLHRAGLGKKEINLVLLLAHTGKTGTEQLVQQYREQGFSWSEIAHNLGLAAREAGQLIQTYPAVISPP